MAAALGGGGEERQLAPTQRCSGVVLERCLANVVLGIRKVIFRLFSLMCKCKLQLSRCRLCARGVRVPLF